MNFVNSVYNYFNPPPLIETATTPGEEILICDSFAAADKLAKERKLNLYVFAKPVFKFVADDKCFKWRVSSKQIVFKTIENGTQPPFYPLISAVRQVADGTNSDYLRAKLNKLMIVLHGTTAWPFNGKVTAQDAEQAFVDFKNLKDPNHQHVENFSRFVRQLNKGLRERSMKLETIAEKIATKANRPLSGGKNLYLRVNELLQLGVNRIENNFKADPTLIFCRVFALHTHIFQENRDSLAAQADLKKCVNQLVRALRKCDDPSLLLQFFSELLGKLDNKSTKWMVQALAADPDFIFYMQQNNRIDEIKQNLLKLVKCDAVIDALVCLGDEELFTDFIDERALILTKAEVGQIFIRLNEKLPENVKMYKNQYLYFLTKLRNVDKLYLLASFTENSELIKRNLSALGLYCKEPLSSFFGNAAFRVLTMPEFSDLKMKEACFKLFLHSGSIPVADEAKFHGHLKTIQREFKEGYSELCGLVLTKMGEEKVLQSHLADAVANYQIIKKCVLISLPFAWKKKKEELENAYKILTVRGNSFYRLEKGLIPFEEGQVGSSSGDCFYGDEIDTLKRRINEELNEPAHREAISALTEAYLLSTNKYKPELVTEMIQCTNPKFVTRIQYLTDYFTGKNKTIPKN